MNQKLPIYLFLLLFSTLGSSLYGQRTVSGTTTDVNGEILSFVNVVIESLSLGTISDLDGNFSLEIPDNEDHVISFSYIGYATKNLNYTGQTVLNAILGNDNTLIDEVVVVGYGSQKRSDVIGSVATIKVDAAKIVPTTNVGELLRGKSPGVQVQLTDPSPGGSSSILIRGKNSFQGGNSPLFIVDGAPVEDINSINIEDVASIEVLKDASAQAIYGSRASNGVILITTKRGSDQKLKVSYHGYTSKQKLTRNFDIFSAQEWADLRMEGYRSENNDMYEDSSFVFTPIQLSLLKDGSFVNWEDETLTDATQRSHSLSLSGGKDKTSIYTSFSYFDQNGIIPGSGYKRATARINLDYKVSDKFSFGSNISLLTDKQDIKSGGLNFISLPPLARIYDENNELVRYPTGEDKMTNPLWNIRESVNIRKKNNFSITFFADYYILPNFKYRLNTFIANKEGQRNSYQTRLHSSAQSTNGHAEIYNEHRAEYLIENIFDYNFKVNDNNRFDMTFVQSVNEREFNSTKTIATQFPNDLLSYEGISSAAEILPVDRVSWDRSMISFMGRMRYYLNDRYLLEINGRTDGSSVFAKGQKWGFFPSAAFAWKAHLEPFLQNIEAINELKFRLSYGSIGNEAIKPYKTLGLAPTKNYLFNGEVVGGYQAGSELFNPNLKWETSSTANLGVDFGLFKHFLVGSIEVYDTKTKDLLINRTTPGGSGYSSIISNIGKVQNRGLEIGITANLISTKKLDWSLTGTWANNKTTIKELYGELDTLGNPIDDISANRFIGYPIDVIFQYEYDGIWQTQDEINDSHMPDARPGDIRVKDTNGNGISDADDRVIIGKDPKWFGSVGTKLSFGGFELYAELYRVHGATKTNSYLAGYSEGATLQGTLNGIKVNYWTPENTEGTSPRPRHSETPLHIWASAVQDASYTRFRTLSLSYNVPKSLVKRTKLGGIRLYGTATNLITWTDFQSYSPELTAHSYPDGKNFVLGLKVTI